MSGMCGGVCVEVYVWRCMCEWYVWRCRCEGICVKVYVCKFL